MIDRMDELMAEHALQHAAAARGGGPWPPRAAPPAGARSPALPRGGPPPWPAGARAPLRSPSASPTASRKSSFGLQRGASSSFSAFSGRPPPEDPLQEYLSRWEGIRRGPLHDLQQIHREAKDLHARALRETQPQRERDLLAQVESSAQRASAAAARAHAALRELAPEATRSGADTSEAALRRQSFAGLFVLFQNTLQEFSQAQLTFRAEMRAKVERLLQAALPEDDDVAVAALASQRDSAAAAIQAGVGAQAGGGPLRSEIMLQLSRDRCDELASLARAAAELKQAFLNVDAAVLEQGEAIDDIAEHVGCVLANVSAGLEELDMAARSQKRCRRCWLALGVVLFVLVLLLVLDLCGKL